MSDLCQCGGPPDGRCVWKVEGFSYCRGDQLEVGDVIRRAFHYQQFPRAPGSPRPDDIRQERLRCSFDYAITGANFKLFMQARTGLPFVLGEPIRATAKVLEISRHDEYPDLLVLKLRLKRPMALPVDVRDFFSSFDAIERMDVVPCNAPVCELCGRDPGPGGRVCNKHRMSFLEVA